MKIYHLKINNLRGIVEVEEDLGGAGVIEAAGKNGTGKSSFLDAIILALRGGRHFTTGKGAKYSAAELIRAGEDHAEVRLTIGDAVKKVVVTRKVKSDGTTALKIEASDGTPMKQGDLDALLNALAIDPVDLARKTPEEQVQALKPLLPPGVDLLLLEKKAEDAEARRGAADSRLSAIYGQQKTPPPPEVKAVSASALAQELVLAQEKNSRINSAGGDRRLIEGHLISVRKQLEDARARLAELEKAEKESREKLQALPESEPLVDTADLEKKLAEAEEINRAAARWERWGQDQADLARQRAELAAEAAAATAERDAARAEIGEALAGAAGAEGVQWDSRCGLKIDGKRLAEMSTSEQVLTGARFAALLQRRSPREKLEALIVRNANTLDSDAKKQFIELARDHGLQVLFETVTEADQLQILLEEGAPS